MDGFPDDDARITRQIQRDVAQAQTSAGQRQPLIEASAGWVFTDMEHPSTPASGKTRIYSNGGRMWATSTAGAVPLLTQDPFPQGVPVSSPPNMTAGATAPGSYSPVYVEALREDIRALRDVVFLLESSLRGSTPGIIGT